MLPCSPSALNTHMGRFVATMLYLNLSATIVLETCGKRCGVSCHNIYIKEGSFMSYNCGKYFTNLTEIYALFMLRLISNVTACLKNNLEVIFPTDFYTFTLDSSSSSSRQSW